MDAFFASVEQRDNPALQGRPVLVGGKGGRGVVAAASYEARTFGCRSAMPMQRALIQCPDAVVVPPRFDAYSDASTKVMEILERASPLVQPISIDEAFVDVTGSRQLLGDGETIGSTLRQSIYTELNLTASVGIGPNKFVAKLASDMNKPDGMTVFTEHRLASRLAPLPVSRMWGIGPKLTARMHASGLKTFEDLQRWSPEQLAVTFGESTKRFHELAFGRDDRPVETDGKAKSIGHEQTFQTDLHSMEEIESILLRHVERVGTRLRKSGRCARSMVIKLRDGEFTTQTRSVTFDHPTDSTALLFSEARNAFHVWAEKEFRPLRLVGFHVSRFEDEQATLFENPTDTRDRQIDAVTDQIKERFGLDAISRTASAFPPKASRDHAEGGERPT